tara:strand:- start:4 stop:549 length:546 start_codon:yes stop_codon:yes gene_type:complete
MKHLPIWYIENIDTALCDEIIAECSVRDYEQARMGELSTERNEQYRNTAIQFLETNHWLEKFIKNIANTANQKCNWNYLISENEQIQFARYTEKQLYKWHTDFFLLGLKPTDRKITVVCLLNDPTEFEGGEFKVRLHEEYIAPLQKGSVIAFPSMLEHCVTPIITGVRYSATMWLSGEKFR